MPLFNGANTLEESVKSVLNQTYKNWELLIVDDCSSDTSYQLAKEIATSYPSKIKVLKTDANGGPAVARNIATKASVGQFITFLDCDDLWVPEKLVRQIEFITTNDYSIIYSNYEKITYKGERSNRIINMPDKVNYSTILKTNAIPCLTAMYDVNKLGKLYQIEDRFYISNEDYIMWVKTLSRGIVAYKINEVLAFYRLTEKSISRNKLKMATIRWHIYKYIIGLSSFKTLYYYICYITISLKKYLK